jgi:hypothetical protein
MFYAFILPGFSPECLIQTDSEDPYQNVLIHPEAFAALALQDIDPV